MPYWGHGFDWVASGVKFDGVVRLGEDSEDAEVGFKDDGKACKEVGVVDEVDKLGVTGS